MMGISRGWPASMAGLGAGVTGPLGRGGVAASCARPGSGLPTAAAPASVAPLSSPRRLKDGVPLCFDIMSSRLLLFLQHEWMCSVPLEGQQRAHRHIERPQLGGAAEIGKVDDEAGREQQ